MTSENKYILNFLRNIWNAQQKYVLYTSKVNTGKCKHWYTYLTNIIQWQVKRLVDSGIAGFRIFIFKHYIRVIMNDLVVLPIEYLIFFIIYLQKTH